MENLGGFITRLERATLQLKALQRTARTTLQVTADLLEQAEQLAEDLDARSKEDAAHEYFRSNGRRDSVTV